MTARQLVAVAVWLGAWIGLLAPAAAQQTGELDRSGGEVLMLLAEQIDRPRNEETTTNYWWRTPNDPAWTPTDRAIETALGDVSDRITVPGSDTRVSRIYRRPDLSVDRATALASIVGAPRIVFGEVRYRVAAGEGPAGTTLVEAESVVQLVEPASEGPEVVQSFRVDRTVVGTAEETELLERARRRVGKRIGRLLARVLRAASSPVGGETREPVFAFHGLQRGEALSRVKKAAAEVDGVEAFDVRWVSEGVVALIANPGREDDREFLEQVAGALKNYRFEHLQLTRRSTNSEGAFEYDVTLESGFGSGTSDDRETDRDER